MSRPSRLLVLALALLGVVLAPAVVAPSAGASNANLKALVSQQQRADSRLNDAFDAAGKRVGHPRTLPSLERRFRHLVSSFSAMYARGGRTETSLRARFAAEPSDSPDAEQGRQLMIAGLTDHVNAYRSLSRRVSSLRSTIHAEFRTERGYKRFLRRLNRSTSSRVGVRGTRRIKHARAAIRAAP